MFVFHLMAFALNRYKVIAMILLLLGLGLIVTTAVLALEETAGVEKELGSIVEMFYKLLSGMVGKTLCTACIIGAGFFLFTGKVGAGVISLIGGILIGLSPRIISALFGTTATK